MFETDQWGSKLHIRVLLISWTTYIFSYASIIPIFVLAEAIYYKIRHKKIYIFNRTIHVGTSIHQENMLFVHFSEKPFKDPYLEKKLKYF